MQIEKHLKVIERLFDRYSYGGYIVACKQAEIEPLSVSEFACMSGRVGVALVMHYTLPLAEGYAKLMRDEINDTPRHVAEQSRGLGDTVAKVTHATGLDKLAALYTEITGKPCGCHERQEALNKLLPYGVREE